ncbi:MAG: MarR family transcriptional regulator [Candidatus Binatia bacterium]
MDFIAQADTVTIMDALRRVVRTLRVGSRAAERDLGLSGAQLYVLQQLAERPAESLTALAARTHTHQSSVSVVVQRLVARRLVVARPARDDARRFTLAITPSGRARLARAPEAAQQRMVRAIHQLRPALRRSLAVGLASVAARMETAPGQPDMFFEDEAERAMARPAPARRGRRRA